MSVLLMLRALIAIMAGLAGVGLPNTGHACSCASAAGPTAAQCEASERAFLATVSDVDWPLAHEIALRREPVALTLDVQQVWSGEVPTKVRAWTGFGNGDCGLPLDPGSRVLICDDADGEAPASLRLCGPPATDEYADALARELDRAQGPGGPPERRPALMAALNGERWVWLANLLPLLAALGATGLGTWLARGARADGLGRGPRLASGSGRVRVFRIGAACAGVAVAIRLLGTLFSQGSRGGFSPLIFFGPLLAATLLGAVLGFAAGRHPSAFWGRLRGMLIAMACGISVMVIGYAPLHVPIDRPDAAACSIARAEAMLAALPADHLSASVLQEAVDTGPRPCTDWGLGRFETTSHWPSPGVCLRFTDARNSLWLVCRDVDQTTTYHGWNGPW
jgi:hypothetical protein